MCNDYGNHVTYREYVEAFSHIRLPVVLPTLQNAPNLQARDEIWPSEEVPIIRPAEGGVELVQRRWGLAPGRPKAPPVINMRSEGRSFTRGRILVPASHFFEFTGKASPKTRWRFTRAGGDWFCFAGLLGRGGTPEDPVEAFTVLTTEPGPDVAPYHSRQPVILERSDWATWLDPMTAAGDLLRPSPPGSLVVVESPRQPSGKGA